MKIVCVAYTKKLVTHQRKINMLTFGKASPSENENYFTPNTKKHNLVFENSHHPIEKSFHSNAKKNCLEYENSISSNMKTYSLTFGL